MQALGYATATVAVGVGTVLLQGSVPISHDSTITVALFVGGLGGTAAGVWFISRVLARIETRLALGDARMQSIEDHQKAVLKAYKGLACQKGKCPELADEDSRG